MNILIKLRYGVRISVLVDFCDKKRCGNSVKTAHGRQKSDEILKKNQAESRGNCAKCYIEAKDLTRYLWINKKKLLLDTRLLIRMQHLIHELDPIAGAQRSRP